VPAGSDLTAWGALAAIVLVAFATEAALGFGAMVISIALGAQLVAIDALLPVLVPLNLCLSVTITARHRRHVGARFLARHVAPSVALGVPLGLVAFARLPGAVLVRAFGVFVVALAALELSRARSQAAPRRLGRLARAALLLLGGAVHGAFATGGPFVVYVIGRELDDKATFRATMSALWTALGVVLCTSYAVDGSLRATSLASSAALALPAAAGLVTGEWLHTRAQARTFRLALFAMLLVAGALLALR
jgi:uncharacterized membrane protein YfcA